MNDESADKSGHKKIEEGRYHCYAWDEVIDFDIDPWGPDDPCPWCGEPYEDDEA